MRLLLFSNLFDRRRRRALLWTTLAFLLFASASTVAVESSNRPKPRATRTTRGGGPQTGTGTSDVVRAIVPPKSQG